MKIKTIIITDLDKNHRNSVLQQLWFRSTVQMVSFLQICGLFAFYMAAVDALECYVGQSENSPFAQFSPAEFQPPKRMKCNKAVNIYKKMLDQNIKTIKYLNHSDVDKQIDELKKERKSLCNNDCLFCRKLTIKIYKDIDKNNIDKTIYSKTCIGKDGMALHTNFPENSCRKLNANEVLGFNTNLMTSRSMSEDQLNAFNLGMQFMDMELCSCSEDGCNDGPINKPTGYIYIFLVSFSFIYLSF